MNAVDVFGGKKALAGRIFHIISTWQSPSPELFRGADPVEAMSRISRSELLDWMLAEGIRLREVMELNWTNKQQSLWRAEMKRRRSGPAIGSSGAESGGELALGLLVRLEALSEICRPPPEFPKKKLKEMQSLRLKYRELLAKPG